MSEHFRLEQDSDDIAWLYIDVVGHGANVLSAEVLEQFDQALVSAAQLHPKGLVLISDKESGFIAGADVRSFAEVERAADAKALIERAHAILHRLEHLAFPTVAAIHGHCLGGGLELALACDYRVASDAPATRIGFPEVRLGIFPGFGGSVRSIRVIGHLRALQLMLGGHTVSARSARRLGLVDLTVPRRQLRQAALKQIRETPHRPAPPLLERIAGWPPLRPLVAAYMKRLVARKVDKAQFPAPYALIDHWRKYAGHPGPMYRSEARVVPELLLTDTAQNLVRVFLLRERLQAEGDKGLFTPRHVHVIGGGVMGGDIAAWCALRGLRVSLQDQAPEMLSRALGRARKLFEAKLKDRYLVQAAMDRLLPDHQGNGAALADVVIEAIFENLEAKQALYAEIEPRLKDGAILATNTSSIPLEDLRTVLQRPERLVGLHFFNPVAKMPLIEVVHTADTDPDVRRRAAAFARHIDKLPLPVRSSPGFLVNRVLLPYLLEAVELLDEGVPAPCIDRAAVKFGMPMGPIELADTVGLDICLAVAKGMSSVLHNEVPERLEALVADGNLGRKSGRGFYAWRDGKALKPHVTRRYHSPEDLTDRLILRLVNEAVACLREGVVSDEDLLDAGVIFGTGFAPFRGGPMHYVHTQGSPRIQDRLHRLEDDHGEHFHADDGWKAVT